MLARWRRAQEEEAAKDAAEKVQKPEKSEVAESPEATNNENEASEEQEGGFEADSPEKVGSEVGESGGASNNGSPKLRTVEVAREAALELLSRGLGAGVHTEEELQAESTTVPGCSEDVDGPGTGILSRSSTGSPRVSMQRRVATLESMIQVRDARVSRLEGELGEVTKREEALLSRVAALEGMVSKLCKACRVPYMTGEQDSIPCEGSPDSLNTGHHAESMGASATTDLGTSTPAAAAPPQPATDAASKQEEKEPENRTNADEFKRTPMAAETSKAVEESMQAISSAVAGILGASVTDTSALSRSLPSHSTTVYTQGRVSVKAPDPLYHGLTTSRTSPQTLRPSTTTTTKVIRAVSPALSSSTGTRTQPIPVSSSSRVQLPFLGTNSPPVSGLSSTGSLAATARRITVVRSPRAGGGGALSPRLPLGEVGGATSPRSGSPTVIRVLRSPRSSPLHGSRVSKAPSSLPVALASNKVYDLGSSQGGSLAAKDADKAESVASGAPTDGARQTGSADVGGRRDCCENNDANWTPRC
mmetsp:Transcript_68113/g.142272  ORF Transcript_68113/g.142272 Transcript_68113/m.142272 type:complete len:533 (-) Transcript_68113:237-1835(-)